ncbi:MAG: hypothetical protein D3910_02465 [Candidatus Electrothrix sp. ATG2]|nr:hypothetical protein [Candidatus Electrothrix sp. ATG2]
MSIGEGDMGWERKKGRKVISILIGLVLLSAGMASAERNKVVFQHLGDKTLKTDCMEIKGEDDVLPQYTCNDDEGNAQTVTPGAEWRLVDAKRVCFHHKVRDTIRVCMEITPLGENVTSCYTCALGEGPPKSFEPTKKWEKLAAEDKRCAPRLQSFDLPRTMVIQGLPDWGGHDAKQE